MAVQDLSLGGGPPGSTATSTLPQGGFAPGQLGNTQLNVVAPLNVNAAPTQAEALYKAVAPAAQELEQAESRLVWEKARSDFKEGQGDAENAFKKNPDGSFVKDDNGNVVWNTDSFAGRSGNYIEGMKRGGAILAGQQAMQQWESTADQQGFDENGNKLTAQQIVQKQQDFIQQQLGGVMSDPVAREELQPMLQRFSQETYGKALIQQHKDSQSEVQSAYEVGVKSILETEGDPQKAQQAIEALGQNLRFAGFDGNQAMVNAATTEIARSVAEEKADPSILQKIDTSRYGGKQMEAFQLAVRSATEAQTKQQQAQNDVQLRGAMVRWQHQWDQERPVPQSQLDFAYQNKWLSEEQYHSLSDLNSTKARGQEENTGLDHLFATVGIKNALFTTLPGKNGQPGKQVTPEMAGQRLGTYYDSWFGSGTDSTSMTNRLMGTQTQNGKPGHSGALDVLSQTGVLDEKSRYTINSGWQMSNPDDVKAAHAFVQYIENGHMSVLGQIPGMTPQRWAELKGTSLQVAGGTDPANVAAGNAQTNPIQKKQRVSEALQGLDDAARNDPNPALTDGSWLGFGKYRLNDLSEGSKVTYNNWVDNTSRTLIQSGLYTGATARATAVKMAISQGTIVPGPNGAEWEQKNTFNSSNPASAPQLSTAMKAVTEEIPNEISVPAGHDPKDYRVIPSGNNGYMIVDPFGNPATLKTNGNLAIFSTPQLLAAGDTIRKNRIAATPDLEERERRALVNQSNY